MIEMANESFITKVSRVFPRVYEYTARLEGVRQRAPRLEGDAVMHKHLVKIAAIIFLLAGLSAAQTSSATRVYTIPDGLFYSVDGLVFHTLSAAVWPAGTKHVLSLDPSQNSYTKSLYAFQGWQYAGGLLANGAATVTISADPSLKEFYALFSVQHALSLNFSNCSAAVPCQSPGTVFVNNIPYTADTDIFFNAGTVVNLTAVPADGYVFTGWGAGQNQVAQGFLNTVTLNSPTVVWPQFKLARRINFVTEPPELDLYADLALVPTPGTLEWVYGTTHTIGVPSPQASRTGSFWAFSKWSDGGAANHSYTVGPGAGPDTLTATFVPATVTDIKTVPAGIPVQVDARNNWPNYFFPWAAGEVHHIEAPAQYSDDKGRTWNFTSWSNGAGRIQDFTVPPSAVPGSTVRLTATYTAVGRLVVSSAVAGLTVKIDGSDCATPCDVQKPVGTIVHVSAPLSVPLGDNSRGDFDGWPGSGSLAADWTITLAADPATPSLTYHTMNRLTAAADPADGASWRMQPASTDGYYDAQSTVVVSVTPQPGFRFRKWSGDATGTAPAASVAMNAPRAVQAMLDRIPYIAPAGVANAAGTTPDGSVAPGSIVSIFGANLASDTIVGPDNPLTQALGCVTVKLGDRLLPLFFVSPAQVNIQLPDDTAAGDQRLTVSCQGLPDVQASFTVARNAPGLFQDAKSFGLTTHEDGSAVTTDSPATRGELLTIYGTGFGPADHGRAFGFPMPAAYPIVDTATVQAGDLAIPSENAFAAAGRIGVDAVQFRLGDGIPSGNLPVRVAVNGKLSNTVLIPIM
jgi:uncharacterized protein (TIGR03437 family)